MLSTIGWSILTVVILVIPAFGVMFPGTISAWSRAVPSYYLVDTLHRVASYGAGWSDVWPNLAILLLIDLLFLWTGALALGRRAR
jgi:ABC-2 type transport system permease protein